MRRIRPLWFTALVFCACCIAQPAWGQFRGANRRQAQTEAAQPAAAAPTTPAAEPLRHAPDRLLTIRDIRLNLRVDLKTKTVDSQATIQLQSLRPVKSVSLDAVGFEVKRVTLTTGEQRATPAHYQHDGKKLVVELGSTWPTGQTGTLQVDYRVHDPKDGLHFYAPSATQPERPLQVWSQGESVSNRYWFPCFDQPDQRQTSEVIATVPEGFEVLSNGKLLNVADNADHTRTFDWKQDKPHPSYLVTLVVGEFDVVKEDWEGIPVLYYVPKGRGNEVASTFRHTREMLSYFSTRYGIRYPWDKYAQVAAHEFGGGMENTSATTLGENVLQDERSLLDRNGDSLISHEMAHQWWGDMVTCRDWSHLWLNEGSASYAEALWDEHHGGADAYAYNMYLKAGRAIRGGARRPVMDLHYTSPDAMFDDRSYPKGAWLLHMLRQRLGDDAFFKGLQSYGTAYKFQSAETEDFRRAMERSSGRDLERFFYDWAARAGSPELEVTTEYAPDDRQAHIVVKQTQAGEAFHFPLKLVLTCEGASQPVVLQPEMTDKELTLQVPLSGALQRIDVDPDQAVLATITEKKGRDLWQAQLLDAPSVALRLRAVRHFAQQTGDEEQGMRAFFGFGGDNRPRPQVQISDEDRALLARAFGQEKFWGVQLSLASALETAGGAVSREALLQGLHNSDARIRRACLDHLGRMGRDAKVAAIAKEIFQKGDPSYRVEGAALATYARQGQKDAVALITPWLSRSSHGDIAREEALSALAQTRDPAVLETLLTWAQPSKPRNCRSAALRGLAQLAQRTKLAPDQRQQVVKTLLGELEREAGFAQLTAVFALQQLGPEAAAALPKLDELIRKESNTRVHQMLQNAADRIRQQAKPKESGETGDVAQLREEVKRLRQEVERLRARVEREDKVGAKSKVSTPGGGS
jgi:aminopeptidase N